MASVLQQLCDSLLAAVQPVETSSAELTQRAARLRAGGDRIGALGRSTQDLGLRSAGAQLLATAAALERAAAISRETVRQAQIYVAAMVASGQVREPAPHAAEPVPVGGASPEYSRRLQRDAWRVMATEFGRELAWELGPEIIGHSADIDLPDSVFIRQAVADVPVAVARIADFFHQLGK